MPPARDAQRCDAIVIGAGHNGLAAAAALARRGRRVIVLERRDRVGGLAALEEFHPGYRTLGMHHDTDLVQPEALRAVGLPAGQPPRMTRTALLAPACGGRGLLLEMSADRAPPRVEGLSARDQASWTALHATTARYRRVLARLFSRPPPPLFDGSSARAWWSAAPTALALRRLGRRDMLELLRIPPMSVADWLDEWFESAALKAVLAAFAVHGSFLAPRSPGTAANLLRRLCLGHGGIAGGPPALVAALERAAADRGVEVRTRCEVSNIRVRDGRVEGVTLVDGRAIDAPLVVAACDPKRALLRLLGPRALTPGLSRRIETYRCAGVTAKVNLALSAPLRFAARPDDAIERAVIAETPDDIERAFDAAKYGRFSERPILDVCVPTVARPDLAPPGHCVVSILVHYAPYAVAGGWSDAQRERLGEAAVDRLARFAPDVRRTLIAREVLTPADVEARYGLTGGHVLHGDHALDQLLVRPAPQCARYATPIEGLLLCGSGSHPGGGLTCAPGILAAATARRAAGAADESPATGTGPAPGSDSGPP